MPYVPSGLFMYNSQYEIQKDSPQKRYENHYSPTDR